MRQLEAAQKKATRLEAQLLRTEQNLDEKEQSIYHNRLESRNKVHRLKHTIQVLFVHLAVLLFAATVTARRDLGFNNNNNNNTKFI